MTEQELRERLTALAGVGDASALATTELLKELDEKRKRLRSDARDDPDEIGRKYRHEYNHARYILDKIAESMKLVDSLKLPEPTEVERLTVDQISALVQRCRRKNATFLRGPALVSFVHNIIEELAKARRLLAYTQSVMRGLGVVPPEEAPTEFGYAEHPSGSPEEVAAAATRAANGIPSRSDPAVIATNTSLPAGHYDKTPKMDQKTGE